MKSKARTFVITFLAMATHAFAQAASVTWNNATTVDTALSAAAVGAVTVSLAPTGSLTGGTLIFEASTDGGVTYPFKLGLARTDGLATDSTFSLNGPVATAWQRSTVGLTHFRVRLNPVITGTGSVVVTVVSAPSPSGPQPSVGPVAINQTQINGVTKSTGHGVPDVGTERIFLAQKTSYYASTTAKTATAAGTGPFFSICGSSTKTVRVQWIAISGTVATAAVYGDVVLKKTSAATAAGTATALVKVPADSTSAASTANLLNYYTALATAGTLVGAVDTQSAVFPITGTVAASLGSVVFDYTNRQESEALVLRGTAQCIEASFGTTTTNAPTLSVAVRYVEE